MRLLLNDKLAVTANGDAGNERGTFIHITDAAMPYTKNLTIHVEQGTFGGWKIAVRDSFEIKVR